MPFGRWGSFQRWEGAAVGAEVGLPGKALGPGGVEGRGRRIRRRQGEDSETSAII